jgi:hypothetical protein
MKCKQAQSIQDETEAEGVIKQNCCTRCDEKSVEYYSFAALQTHSSSTIAEFKLKTPGIYKTVTAWQI